VDGKRQKDLILILARELASKLATAMFIADAKGGLVFYNEPAEEILGRTFAEAGEMSAESWTSLFDPETLDGRPMAGARADRHHAERWALALWPEPPGPDAASSSRVSRSSGFSSSPRS